MSTTVDDAIAACAREPIQFAGAIQAHGYLISCATPDWTIRQVSSNVVDLLEVDVDGLLGHSLREYVSEDVLQSILDTLLMSTSGSSAQRAGEANLGPLGTACDLVVHAADSLIHIEIEPRAGRDAVQQPTLLAQSMVAAVSGGAPESFYSYVAAQVRQLTGYDRVMVYQFLHDGTGEVIAESRSEDVESYLGLRYPASDIPPQARALYLHSRLRVIPDVDYVPVPIIPGTVDGHALDMSQHALRSVSPVHLEYLRNMGVGASMSISIIAGGQLWGLIACHHRTPRRVPAAIRAAADLFGMFVSMRVSSTEQQRAMAHFEHAQQLRDAIAHRLGMAQDFEDALRVELPLLSGALGADGGAALWQDAHWHAVGHVPDPRRVPQLLAWLQASTELGPVYSDRADEWAPLLEGDHVAGVMALRLGGGDWLLLFRDEQVEQVRWAGEPLKALVPTDDGMRLAPRRSFAEWRESVRGRSLHWSEADRRGATRLLRLLGDLRRRARSQDTGAPAGPSPGQMVMDERRQRLDALARMMDGLSHVDPALGSTLDARIQALEAELARLAGATDAA